MSQKIKLSFGTVSKSDTDMPNYIQDDIPDDIPDVIAKRKEIILDDIPDVHSENAEYIQDDIPNANPAVIPDAKLTRSQKWNKKVKDKKASFEFVMEKDELARLKEHARNRNMTVTALLREAVSHYIQDYPVK